MSGLTSLKALEGLPAINLPDEHLAYAMNDVIWRQVRRALHQKGWIPRVIQSIAGPGRYLEYADGACR